MIDTEILASYKVYNDEAARYISGGVVSLNRKVTPPIVFEKAKGCKLYDINGQEYIDYHAAFAPYLLGHNFDPVNEAVIDIIKQNRSLYGSGTNSLEIALAKMLCEIIPSLELLQITNTGSEATAHAIRLSRAYTGREDIILAIGGYNGWHNEVSRAVMPSLAHVGKRVCPGEYPFIPLSAGIPDNTKRRVHLVNFNDLESVAYIMKRYPVACVLAEPVLQNIGVVLPKTGYLQNLIQLCEDNGTVCIFDEVKTGFRSALGGYQSVAGVTPHLSVFGKAIANGYPLGVIGGKKEILNLFHTDEADKRVLIAGTYNAHPINTAAAIATLKILRDPTVYDQINHVSNRLYTGLQQIINEKGIPAVISKNTSAYCIYFAEKAPEDLHDILETVDFKTDIAFRKASIEKGIYHIPIACKQSSVSYAHTEEDIDRTLQVTREVFSSL